MSFPEGQYYLKAFGITSTKMRESGANPQAIFVGPRTYYEILKAISAMGIGEKLALFEGNGTQVIGLKLFESPWCPEGVAIFMDSKMAGAAGIQVANQ